MNEHLLASQTCVLPIRCEKAGCINKSCITTGGEWAPLVPALLLLLPPAMAFPAGKCFKATNLTCRGRPMTKEQDFKTRFFAVLEDLHSGGIDDGEAMWLLGSLAAGLVDDLKATDWPSAKRLMDDQTYDALLRTFEAEGNAHHRAGRAKQAYAIQALAMSLIAHNQTTDPQIAAGEPLLDHLITASIATYRRQATRPN